MKQIYIKSSVINGHQCFGAQIAGTDICGEGSLTISEAIGSLIKDNAEHFGIEIVHVENRRNPRYRGDAEEHSRQSKAAHPI